MSDKFVVISGCYNNKDYRQDFIQAIGTYNDMRQAYGVALLQLSESVHKGKDEKITPLFPLEGDTGYGIELKHENYTDFCYVLFAGADDWGDKGADGGENNANTE